MYWIYGYTGTFRDLVNALIIIGDIFTSIELFQVKNYLDAGFFVGKGLMHIGFEVFGLATSISHFFIV